MQRTTIPRILASSGLLITLLVGLPTCNSVLGLDAFHDGICNPGAKRSCYGGPRGTEGVGICKAGTQTCDEEGLAWSACEGDVQPQVEDCGKVGDEDCDGVSCSEAMWSQRFGDGVGEQVGRAVAWDTEGNLLVTGYVNGTVDFGGGPLDATGGHAVAAKLGSKGEHVWSSALGDGSGRGIAIDEDGNAIIVGSMAGAHVAKFDPSGKQLWSKSFVLPGGATDYASPAAVAVDGDGSVVVAGSFGGNADFGGGVVTAQNSGHIFVVKLTTDGAHVWDKEYGDPAGQGAGALGVAVDRAGDIVAVGSMSGAIDFGNGPMNSAGGSDIFVAKLDSNGEHVWSNAFGDAEEQYAQSVAIDKRDGSILLAGPFSGRLEFSDVGGRTSAGGKDGFVAKLDAKGSYLWMKSFGDAGVQEAHGVAVDASGNVIVTGYFEGTVDMGTGPVSSMGGGAMFLGKYDPDGKPTWNKYFLDASANAVATDALGHLAVTGLMSATIDFGAGPVTAVGAINVFVATFDP